MSTYKIEFNWSGSTWTEYDVVLNDFQKLEVLHKGLRSADNTCSFSMTPDITLYNLLRGINTKEVPVRILKDTVPYFYGYLRKTFNIKKTQKLEPTRIELVSPSFRLKKKVGNNLSYSNITVTTLLANLLTDAGVTLYTLPTISSTIPGFSVIANEGDTYHRYIEDVLFEYGYVGYFDEIGRFITQKLVLDDLTTSNLFDGSNCLNEIEQTKKEEVKDGVIVVWTGTKALSNAIVFSDTTGAKNGFKCFIELPPLGYMGNGENNEWYAELDHPDGAILFASGITLDVIKDSDIAIQTFEQVGNRVKIKVRNTSTTFSRFIKKFDLKASSCIIRTDLNKSTPSSNLVNGNIEKIETKYIFNKVNGDLLADKIASYYSYSDFQYKLTSKTDYPIGAVVTITDYGIGTNKARIIEKRTQEQTGIISYVLEAVDEYIPTTINNETTFVTPRPSGVINSIQTVTEAGFNEDGTLAQPINSNTMIQDITPTGDGLYLTKSYIGLRKDSTWKSYIASDGDFAFRGDENNFIQWNGTKLTIKGDVQVAGDVDINGTVKLGDALQSAVYTEGEAGWKINGNGDGEFNNIIVRGKVVASSTSEVQGTIKTGSLVSNTYVAGTSGFSLNNAGDAELNNVTVRGSIYSSVGTIGGFTLGSDSLIAGSGTTRVSLSTANGIHLGHDTFASAPFRVTRDGVLTATGVNITGAITATSGSFTGSITSASGTVGGWILDTDLLKSSISGARVELNKTKNRMSIFGGGVEKVVVGYLEGLPIPKSNPVQYYTASDYGFYAAPGDTISFTGDVSMDGDAFSILDGSISLTSRYPGWNDRKTLLKMSGVNGEVGFTGYPYSSYNHRTFLQLKSFDQDTGQPDLAGMFLNYIKDGTTVTSAGFYVTPDSPTYDTYSAYLSYSKLIMQGDVIIRGTLGGTSLDLQYGSLKIGTKTIDEDKITQWDSGGHTHDNLAVLDAITSTKTTQWDWAYTGTHSHDQLLNPVSDVTFGNITMNNSATRYFKVADAFANSAGRQLWVDAGSATGLSGTPANLSGGHLYLNSGKSVGTSTSAIFFQTPTPAGTSGIAQNALATRFVISSTGCTSQVPLTATKIFGSGTGNDYLVAGYETRGNGLTNTIFPAIGFNQPGTYGGLIQQRSATEFRFLQSGGVDYANIGCADIYGTAFGRQDDKDLIQLTSAQNVKINGTLTMGGSLNMTGYTITGIDYLANDSISASATTASASYTMGSVPILGIVTMAISCSTANTAFSIILPSSGTYMVWARGSVSNGANTTVYSANTISGGTTIMTIGAVSGQTARAIVSVKRKT